MQHYILCTHRIQYNTEGLNFKIYVASSTGVVSTYDQETKDTLSKPDWTGLGLNSTAPYLVSGLVSLGTPEELLLLLRC